MCCLKRKKFFEHYNDEAIGSRPLLMLGVLLILTGFQSLLFGLLGEMLTKVNNDQKDEYIIKDVFE